MSTSTQTEHVPMPAVQRLIQKLGSAESAEEIAAIWRGGGQKSLGIEYEISVDLYAAPQGFYRVRHHGPTASPGSEPEPRKLITDLEQLKSYPLVCGGIIGEFIGDGQPKVRRGLCVTDDPVLGNAIGEFRSATVAPIRLPDGDFWVIGLRKSNDLSETDLRGQMWIQALLVRSVSAQNWTRWARDERDLYDRELRAVARLQRSLLPIIPARSGFEIAASYETCTQAGGDHYDILQLPSGELAFLIADVSGHGAAAATGTALLHATFHAYTGSDFDPAMVLNWIDCQITQYLLEGSFITAFLGVLNPVNGHIVYGSAGHCPPYLRSAKG